MRFRQTKRQTTKSVNRISADKGRGHYTFLSCEKLDVPRYSSFMQGFDKQILSRWFGGRSADVKDEGAIFRPAH